MIIYKTLRKSQLFNTCEVDGALFGMMVNSGAIANRVPHAPMFFLFNLGLLPFNWKFCLIESQNILGIFL